MLFRSADADALDPAGTEINDDDTESFDLPLDSSIRIVKTGAFQDENADTYGQAGETIDYTYDVENTGSTTLSGLAVTDLFTAPALNANLGPITCAPIAQGGTLLPGDTTQCTATYTLLQADVDAGLVYLGA